MTHENDLWLGEIISKLHYVADLLRVAHQITRMPNCNDCGVQHCEHKPEWGMPVRYNCPLWKEWKEQKHD